MQLAPGERSILAYFPTSEEAQKAAHEIEAAGIPAGEGALQVDRVSRYGVSNDASYDNLISQGTTLTGPTLFSSQAGGLTDSERVLLAADPSASGIGDTNYGVAGGRAFLLTVVTTHNQVDQAVKIVKNNGGRV